MDQENEIPIEENNFLEGELAEEYREKEREELIALARDKDHTAMAVLTDKWVEKEIHADLETAVSWLEELAEQGDMIAQYKLGTIYREVPNEENLTKAIFWTEKAAEQGHLIARGNMADLFIRLYPDKPLKENPMAVYWYEKDGQYYNLGYEYATEGNTEKAVEYYKKSIEFESEKTCSTFAMRNLSLIYERKEGFIDPAKAFKWTHRAAENGLLNSMCELGQKYAEGDFVEADAEKAAYWLNAAAEGGYVDALEKLGDYYINGEHGFPQDDERGVSYLRLAAEEGSSSAQYMLAYYHHTVTEDIDEAIEWYRQSGENGFFKAYRLLGDLYADDDNEHYAPDKAQKYYKKAAKLGCRTAMHKLGDMHFYGTGTDVNEKLARKWLEKAVDQNFNEPENVAIYHEMDIDDIDPDDIEAFGEEVANIYLDESYLLLCEIYLYGHGAEKDVERAAEYLALAKDHDCDASDARRLEKRIERGGHGLLQSLGKKLFGKDK